jgi:hypothetical protein
MRVATWRCIPTTNEQDIATESADDAPAPVMHIRGQPADVHHRDD